MVVLVELAQGWAGGVDGEEEDGGEGEHGAQDDLCWEVHGESAGGEGSEWRQAEEGGGVDAHGAAAHLVGGQLLHGYGDGGKGEDHAEAFEEHAGLREPEGGGVAEDDEDEHDGGGGEGDDASAMVEGAAPGDEGCADDGAEAGGCEHESVDVFALVELVADEPGDEGEKWEKEEAGGADDPDEDEHLGVSANVAEA